MLYHNSSIRSLSLKLRLIYLLFIFPAVTFSQSHTSREDSNTIEVSVIPNRPDWMYQTGEEADFKVFVKSKNKIKELKVNYEVGPEKMEPLKKGTLVLKGGVGQINGGTMNVPGFLRCQIVLQVGNKEFKSIATAGFSAERIPPTAVVPKDFEQFWKQAKTEAENVPLGTQMAQLAHRSNDSISVYQINFQNNRVGSRIYGILCIPKGSGKFPAVIRFPGAGVRSYNGNTDLAMKGIITLEIGIHGMPVTLENEVYSSLLQGALSGYPFFNLQNRDLYYYKRVVQGCLKAVDFIYSLPQFDGSSLAVMGSSQGGALSVITTALDSRVKCLVALCPAMSDMTGYLYRRAGGWPHMFDRNNIGSYGSPESIATSAYYDVVNFARLVKVPGFYSWGLNDETTPPTSMYAAYNCIPGSKELYIIPNGTHKVYPEQVQRFNEWLLTKLLVNRNWRSSNLSN